jgi:hypothetical protein
MIIDNRPVLGFDDERDKWLRLAPGEWEYE